METFAGNLRSATTYTCVQREMKAYEALTKIGKTSGSTGKQCVIRQAFEVPHGDGNYHFLIHEPLDANLQFFLDISDGSFPISYAKHLASHILHALEFVHSARVIHAGPKHPNNTLCPLILRASNILLRIEDGNVLKDGEEAEIEILGPRKIIGHSVVFETKDLPGPLHLWIGGMSRPVPGKDSYTERIHPAAYRAPEVFLHLPWGWSLCLL